MNLEHNKIYNCDCLEYMKNISNETFDLIIADPPYGQNIRNEKGKIDFDSSWNNETDYINWCKIWIDEGCRILKDDGIFLIWGVAPMINEISHFLNKKSDMKFYTQIIWHVSDGLRPTNRYFYSNYQVLIGYSKSKKEDFNSFNNHKGKYNHITEKAKSYSGTKNMGTVWKHHKICKHHKEGTPHPTQKPLELNNRIIQATTDVDDLIYIPFAGSGSEIESCIKNNRNYIATEINKEYIDEIILKRIKDIK